MSRKNFKVEYLYEFEAIFKNILGGYSGAPGWLNLEKKPEVKNLMTLSLYCKYNMMSTMGLYGQQNVQALNTI